MFASRSGHIGDIPVELTTRRFQNETLEALTFATIVDAEGQTRSVTLIGFPRDDHPLPVLGVDLIAFRGSLSLVALDLAPTSEHYWNHVARPVLERIRGWSLPHLKARKQPDFTQGAFSELAMIAAAPRGAEEVACEAAAVLTEVYMHLPRKTWTPSDSDRSVAQWCQAELKNRKEHTALARVFGDSFAVAYLDFLFGSFVPDELPDVAENAAGLGSWRPHP